MGVEFSPPLVLYRPKRRNQEIPFISSRHITTGSARVSAVQLLLHVCGRGQARFPDSRHDATAVDDRRD